MQRVQTIFLVALLLCCSSHGQLMKCTYGERGSLTATCVNATSSFFRATSYRFDSLDETVRCINCNLETIESNAFDLSGNEIQTLDLQNSKIATLKDSAFVGLVFLRNLYLQNNKISAVYPGVFKGTKKIRNLQMSNNSISVLVASGFKELLNLTVLNLEHNDIKSIGSKAFEGLFSLVDLNLGHNNIKEVKDVFNHLPKILKVNLENNEIESIKSLDFANISTLIQLNLANNMIKTLDAKTLITLHNLETLDLSNNVIENIESLAFDGLNKLEVLNLEGNKLKHINKGAFLGLTQLRDLTLAFNKLQFFKTGLFGGMPEMRYLNISHNEIVFVKRTGIMALHSLHTIDLGYNNLTDLDYKVMYYHMPRVTYMNLIGNYFTCDLITELDNYFLEDNIKLSVDGFLRNDSCIPSKAKQPVPEEVYADEEESSGSFATSYIVYPFIVMMNILVFVLLFRLEMKLRNMPNMSSKSVSHANLIHSEMNPAEEY